MNPLNEMVSEPTKQMINNHPYIAIFTVAVCCTFLVAGGVWSRATFADKTQLESVQSQVQNVSKDLGSLKAQIQRSDLESGIRALDTEIYQLQRLADAGDANPRDLRRLDALKSDLRQKERELQRIDE